MCIHQHFVIARPLLWMSYYFHLSKTRFPTSAQVGQKLEFGLPTNLGGSGLETSRQLVGKLMPVINILSNHPKIKHFVSFQKTYCIFMKLDV